MLLSIGPLLWGSLAELLLAVEQVRMGKTGGPFGGGGLAGLNFKYQGCVPGCPHLTHRRQRRHCSSSARHRRSSRARGRDRGRLREMWMMRKRKSWNRGT